MPNQTANITPEFQSLNDSLVQLEREPSFVQALRVIDSITGLLGVSTFGTERLYNVDKIKQNPGWFVSADGFADRRACYKLAENNPENLDLKVYWVQKTSKRIISSAIMFTPNFEDEPFNIDLNVGIDFFIPPSADRIIIALSNRYLIRTLELSGSLSLTQQEIFTKWIQKFDFSNKAQAHQVLWESLDLQPLNKQFYKEVTRFFTELIQHLETDTKLFQSKEAAQFTNRLVGRLIFCWFLRKKQIIADDRAYFEIDESTDSSAYYHNRLEKLFFSILNTKIDERSEEDKTTPFLNGGLFEAKQTDHRANKDLTFPKDYFHRFFQFLDGYNFTTDESTSEFQQVAIDPEMLGRIFENLLAEQTEETGQQARKAKGAFYTPREIVDYMCKESLREYVRTILPDDNKRDHVLELLFDKKEHQFDYSNYRADIQPYKKNILDALDEITILDPACGSGAFPMGMLQLMLSIYERIDARFDSYKTKLGIVKNNLFGVDIEPMAVEISRLRAWLSIIVDVDMNPTKENLGIEPLPNLEFKFVAANSLIPLETGGTDQMEFDNKNLQEEMSRIRDRYFNTNSGKVKEKMKLDYEKLLCSGNTMFKSDRQKKLLTYHPFDSSKSAGFFDPKLMFGLEGFDVVISNPPYVSFYSRQSARTSSSDVMLNELASSYAFTKYNKKTGRLNLWMFFIERIISLLSDAGSATLILDVNITKDVAIDIRRFLLDKTSLIEFIHGLDEFENVASGQVILSFLKNAKSENVFKVKEGFIEPRIIHINQDVVVKHPYVFWRSNNNELLQKLEGFSKFSQIPNLKVITGIQIGGKEYVKGKTIKDHFYRDAWDFQKVFPSMRISSVQRYSIPVPEKGILFDLKLASEVTRLTQKSAVVLKKYVPFLNKEKIFLRQSATCLAATLGKSGECGEYSLFTLASENPSIPNKVLLALINSQLLNYYATQTEVILQKKGTQPQIRKNGIERLPTVIPSENMSSVFINLVDRIFDKKIQGGETQGLEKEINELVMDLYQLTEEEKEIIRKS